MSYFDEITAFLKEVNRHVLFLQDNISYIHSVELSTSITFVVSNVYLDYTILFHAKDDLSAEESSSFNLNYHNFRHSGFFGYDPFRCYIGKSDEFSNFEKNPEREKDVLTISNHYDNHFDWFQSVFLFLIESFPIKPAVEFNHISVYRYFKDSSDLHKKMCFENDLIKESITSLVKPLIAINDIILFCDSCFSSKLKLGVVAEIRKFSSSPLRVQRINRDFGFSLLMDNFIDYYDVHAIMDESQLNKLKDRYKIKNSSQLMSYINNTNEPEIKFKYKDYGKKVFKFYGESDNN